MFTPAPQPPPQAQSSRVWGPSWGTQPTQLANVRPRPEGFVQRTFRVCTWHLAGDQAGDPALRGQILWEESQDMGYLFLEAQLVGGQGGQGPCTQWREERWGCEPWRCWGQCKIGRCLGKRVSAPVLMEGSLRRDMA